MTILSKFTPKRFCDLDRHNAVRKNSSIMKWSKFQKDLVNYIDFK